MRKLIMLAAAVTTLAGSALAANGKPQQRLVSFAAQVKVEVDKNGTVTSVTPDPSLSPAMNQVVQTYVGQWRFAAPIQAGQPVGGVTYVQLDACATPKDGKYLFAVKYRSNGPGRTGKTPALQFPSEAQRYGVSAKLQLTFRVLAEGGVQIEDIVVVDGGKRFEKAFRAAASAWLLASRFEPEQVDGKPVTTRVSEPMEFITGRSFGSLAAAKADFDKQMQRMAAQQPECQEVLNSGDKQERQVALDSPFHLIPAN